MTTPYITYDADTLYAEIASLRTLLKQERVEMTKIYTLQELQYMWNAQADKSNSWDELGLDEIVTFVQEVTRPRNELDSMEE